MRRPQKLGLLLGIVGFCLPLAFRFEGLTTAGHIAMGILLMAACFWISEPIPIYATSLLVILLGALLLSGQGPLYLGAELPLVEPGRVEADVWEAPTRAVSERGEVFVVKGGGQQAPGTVWVRFADTGPGIPAGVRARIFEPSFTTKTASGSFGLGLGLTIANEIVQKHGGSIEVGNALGGGAVFTVTLPLSPKP